MDFNDFVPTKPTEWQIELIKAINSDYQDLAGKILTRTSSSAHRTAALRLLLESKMTLIHAITHP